MGELPDLSEEELEGLTPVAQMYYRWAKWAIGVLGEEEWRRLGKVRESWSSPQHVSFVLGFWLIPAAALFVWSLAVREPPLPWLAVVTGAAIVLQQTSWWRARRAYKRAKAEVTRFATDDPRRLATLIALGDDLAGRIRGPMTPEEEERESDHTVAFLHEQFVQPAKAQLAEQEWRKLVWLRDWRERFHAARNISLLFIVVVLLPLGLVAYTSAHEWASRPVSLRLPPVLLVIPLVPAIAGLGMWLVGRALTRELERLSEGGRDAEAIARGLQDDLEAARVAGDKAGWVAAAREENRPWTAWIRTEFSGLHLLLWVALLLVPVYDRWQYSAPKWVGPLMVAALLLWVAKLIAWFLLLCTQGGGKVLHYYRYAGTWRGMWPSLFVVLGAITVFGLLCLGVSDVLGR
jgi:hypothetical protein